MPQSLIPLPLGHAEGDALSISLNVRSLSP
jgi:hypothetical protein